MPILNGSWPLSCTFILKLNRRLIKTARNDILRKHGIIPERPPSPTPIIEEALAKARREAHANRLEDKSLEELGELEDEDEDEFLQKYR